MRANIALTAAFAASLFAEPSWAIGASDTMAAWKHATAAEKSKLLDEVLKRKAPSRVLDCLNAASDIPGHADLPIAKVAKACDSDEGQPV